MSRLDKGTGSRGVRRAKASLRGQVSGQLQRNSNTRDTRALWMSVRRLEKLHESHNHDELNSRRYRNVMEVVIEVVASSTEGGSSFRATTSVGRLNGGSTRKGRVAASSSRHNKVNV